MPATEAAMDCSEFQRACIPVTPEVLERLSSMPSGWEIVWAKALARELYVCIQAPSFPPCPDSEKPDMVVHVHRIAPDGTDSYIEKRGGKWPEPS